MDTAEPRDDPDRAPVTASVRRLKAMVATLDGLLDELPITPSDDEPTLADRAELARLNADLDRILGLWDNGTGP